MEDRSLQAILSHTKSYNSELQAIEGIWSTEVLLLWRRPGLRCSLMLLRGLRWVQGRRSSSVKYSQDGSAAAAGAAEAERVNLEIYYIQSATTFAQFDFTLSNA